MRGASTSHLCVYVSLHIHTTHAFGEDVLVFHVGTMAQASAKESKFATQAAVFCFRWLSEPYIYIYLYLTLHAVAPVPGEDYATKKA